MCHRSAEPLYIGAVQNTFHIQESLAKIPRNASFYFFTLLILVLLLVIMVTVTAVERGFRLSASLGRIYVFFYFLSLLGGRNLQHLLEQVCIKGNDCAIY